VVVTYPGRFQPFHQGHAGVFSQLQKKFGAENVFIATSNDQSSAKSPFNFSDKYQLMTAAGVPADKIIQTNSMYALPEGIDPLNTIFITAVGAPDADRLNPDTVLKRDKKDKAGNIVKPAGSPGYYKKWDPSRDPVSSDQHGYVIVIPEIKKSIRIAGQTYDVSHGTETRNLWNAVRDDEKSRLEFLSQLYGRPSLDLANIFDKIPQTASEDIAPGSSDSTSPIHGGQIYEQDVAEAADPRFMNFMNTSLGDRTDQPSKKIKTGQDWYDNTPTMNIDSGMVSYRPALDFCNKTLQKLNPSQKIKLSTLGEQGVVSWLAKQAKKQGLIPDQFMEEDIYEVQDFLPEVFHDPAITSWALVLTDGEPLPTPPTKGPFKVIMNQGLPSPTKGYANSDWVNVDTLDNLPAAEEIFKGMVLKNPNYYVGITGADHKFVKFQDPHKQDVAEGAEEAEKYRAQLLKTAPRVMDFLAKAVKGWRPSEQEMLGAIDTAYTVMKHTGDVKQAGKAMVDELNTLHRMSQGQSGITEGWSQKYKRSINCSHPKGFSQKAHCAGKKKHNESIETEMVCEDCGMCETHGDHSQDNLAEACWKGYHKEGMKTMFGKRYPNCVKNKNESLETYIRKGECPGCGGEMVSEGQLNEKQDACYHKVKSRYKVWPSAYASGALVQCRKKGAANWGNKSESISQEEYDQLDENLKKWFSDKWVRFGPDGKIRGDCARGSSSEGKPKCLPQSKAHALGKKGRASAGARKRKQDPDANRSGKAINVATKTKSNEGASGVIATKKQARDPRYSMSLTKDVRPGQIEKNLRAFKLAEQANNNNDMFELFAKFLPLAMRDLGLTMLPKIVPELRIESTDGQATFGRFVDGEMTIQLAMANRHPVDILRTLAHELVHYKQKTLGKIKHDSGETGSPEENQANTIAGIIMRHFNKEYPDAVNMQPIELNESQVTVNYGIGKNPGKLVKVGADGRVPHAKLHVNVDKKTAKKLGIPHFNENFADGRNPGDKGSLKAKVKGKVTMAKAQAILKNKNSTPRAKQLAHWFINMNKGRKK
jgi:hypothetical protein